MDFGIGVIYRIVKDVFGYFTRNMRRLTQTDRVNRRAKWEDEFKSKLLERRQNQLRSDVIIRDVQRVDDYPETEEEKRISSWFKKKKISPWFKVGLLDTYHRGILLGLEWVRLAQDKTGAWHYPARGQKETVNAVLTGYVRYENIERVNWDGDEYYGFPHIYCHFDEKGKMPYEKLMFCERRELKPEGIVSYTDLASFNDVEKHSKSRGTSRYYPPAK